VAKFVKGQSGNPGGRPKSDFSLAAEAQKHGPEVVEFMVRTLRGEPISKSAIVAGKVKKVKVCPNFDHQQRAAEWLADRGWGKAATVLAGEGGVGPSEIRITLASPLPEIKT
jgi:Family of unknown function (DUF5681)